MIKDISFGDAFKCANRDFCDRIEKRLKESNDER